MADESCGKLEATPQMVCAGSSTERFWPDPASTIFPVSYPRSGTTWVSCVATELLFRTSPRNLTDIASLVPDVHDLPERSVVPVASRYLVKSHFQLYQVHGFPAYGDYRRVIYLIRDPRNIYIYCSPIIFSSGLSRTTREVSENSRWIGFRDASGPALGKNTSILARTRVAVHAVRADSLSLRGLRCRSGRSDGGSGQGVGCGSRAAADPRNRRRHESRVDAGEVSRVRIGHPRPASRLWLDGAADPEQAAVSRLLVFVLL